MIKVCDLFDLNHTIAGKFLKSFDCPWEALPLIGSLVVELGRELGDDFDQIAPGVWVHKTATVAPTASVSAPCIIGAHTEVRHCAFIRGNALVGENCVIGNSVEVKNAILFDGVQVPHYNYVGDSILGYKAHMGAGSVTSNVKSDKAKVSVKDGCECIETGLKKFGAMIGDRVEVGCNSVLNPGTVVGRDSMIYPLSCVRGVVPERSIWKTGGIVVKREER